MHFRSQRKSSQDVSLSDYIETGNDGAALSLMDVVSEDEDLLEKISTRDQVSRVLQAVKEDLTEQEQLVIRLRYGLFGNEEVTQREIGKKLGISRSYVSRIEKKALAKLNEGFLKSNL